MRLNKNPHRGDPSDEEGVNWDDVEIHKFLVSLDDDEELVVTPWEAQFIESNLDRATFSRKQRIVIRKLNEKYGH
jgi:hypothetical protein